MIENILKLVIGESLASGYGALTKLSPFSITFQTWFRSVIISIVSSFGKTDELVVNETAVKLGIVNLIHVLATFFAFKNMDTGIAILIFYLYPLFYLLLKKFKDKERIEKITYLLISLSLIGIFIIYYDSSVNIDILPLIAILVSSYTEALIVYYTNQLNTDDSNNELLISYLPTAVIMSFMIPIFIKELQGNLLNLGYLTIFNLLFGYVGYNSIYTAVKKLSPKIYSIFSYSGVITGVIAGRIILGEKIGINGFAGSLLILSSMLVQMIISDIPLT